MGEGVNQDPFGAKASEIDAGDNFLVVGLGASAGGIQALRDFFAHVPAASGMAYVVILHLSPDHDSQLASVLQGVAPIPVTKVEERVGVEPNRVYVISPNKSLEMRDGHLEVSDATSAEARRAPIDLFFRTLADSHGMRAVSVVLSGTNADGSMGMKRVKEMGGICIVQDPQEAEYEDMPRHSLKTGLVDYVLPAAEIPARIIAYREQLRQISVPETQPEPAEADMAALRDIFRQLRTRIGHDFSNYKRPTVMRRIARRMSVHQLHNLTAYAQFMQEHTEEANALLKDLLISVTNFFRDPKAFEKLREEIIPRLFEGKTADDQVRVWVAGCATGEEAYTLTMLLVDYSSKLPVQPEIQVFATDIDEAAIATARDGYYTLNEAADVPSELLSRYFVKSAEGYRVRGEIRERVLFAVHNLIKDPPFAHLDLATCRNLLIYLNQTAQRHVMNVMHFALNAGGYLMLGVSESIDGATDLFAPVDKEHRIYQGRAVETRMLFPIPDNPLVARLGKLARLGQGKNAQTTTRFSYAELHQSLLERYAPPSLVVNEEYDIVHVSENAGRYLEFRGGDLSFNLLMLVRPELRLELRTALYQAAQTGTDAESRPVSTRAGNETKTVKVRVRPDTSDKTAASGFLLVLFEEVVEAGTATQREAALVAAEDEPLARRLEEELLEVKAQLSTTIEQHELQREELKASNEELLATNEEVRSAAEELETSKEELQSINEELTTVNQELKIKIDELGHTNNDLRNLMNSTQIGTVFLDRALLVKLFTPRARDIFNLIPSDVGRPLSDITSNLSEDEHFIADAKSVLDTLQPVERAVRMKDGQTFLMQIVPYRTIEERINGVVVNFLDITERQRAQDAVRESEEQFRRAIENAPIPVIMHAEDGEVLQISRTWTELTGYTIEDTPTFDTWLTRAYGEGADEVRQHMHELFKGDRRTHNVEFPIRTQGGGLRYWSFSASSPGMLRDGRRFIIGMAVDITERKQAEEIATADLEAATLLRELGARLASEDDMQRLYQEILAAAVALTRADAGTVQLLDEETQELVLLASQGFGRKMTERFRRVPANSGAPCGVALSRNERAVMNFDVSAAEDPDGSLRAHVEAGFLSGQSTPLVARSGKSIGMLSTHWRKQRRPAERELRFLDLLALQVSDLIERRWAEEALRQSEERFRAMFEQANVGILQITLDGQLLMMNQGFCRLASYTLEETRGLNLRDITHPDDYEEMSESMRRLIDGDIPGFSLKKRCIRKDGQIFWCMLTAAVVRTPAQDPLHLVAIVEDLSERTAAEERLHESEQRLRLTLESIEDYAVLTLDTEGHIQSWNAGAQKAFGYTEAEAVGQHTAIIFTPEDRERGIPTLEMKTARERERAADERWHLRRDGTRFYMSGVLVPLRDESGTVTGYLKIARDLTEHRRAEEELRRAHGESEVNVRERTLELAQANESLRAEISERIQSERARMRLLRQIVRAQEDERRRIARDIHDQLGQQMTALRLNLAALEQGNGGKEELRRKLEQTKVIAERLDADVDFLAWELRPAALDEIGLAEALGNFVREWSKYSGVEAQFHTTGIEKGRLSPETEINLYRITQEALNNTLKYARATRVDVLLERRDQQVVLIVEDDGTGFDPKQAASDDGHKGLGLIGMRERAALMGGTLEIESKPEEGTTIFARVPVKFLEEEEGEETK